jgi:flagella basal body P-ring formation protein FlgA
MHRRRIAVPTTFVLACACVLGDLRRGRTAEGAAIRLRGQAVVSSAAVALGDLADILDPDPRRQATLSRVVIMDASEARERTSIDFSSIQTRLRERGVNLADLRFYGAHRVSLHRNGPLIAGHDDARDKGRSEYWSALVSRMLSERIAESTGRRADEVRVRVEAAAALDHLARHQPAEWDLVAPRRWTQGKHKLMLEVSPHEPIRLDLVVDVEFAQVSAVAAEPIRRGQVITAEQIRVEPARTQRNESAGLAAEIVGKQAARSIAPGAPIAARDVKGPILVTRNGKVVVQVRYRTAQVEREMVARQDGRLGDLITVQDPLDKHELEVRVVGPQTAELPVAAPDRSPPAGTRATSANGPSPPVALLGR